MICTSRNNNKKYQCFMFVRTIVLFRHQTDNVVSLKQSVDFTSHFLDQMKFVQRFETIVVQKRVKTFFQNNDHQMLRRVGAPTVIVFNQSQIQNQFKRIKVYILPRPLSLWQTHIHTYRAVHKSWVIPHFKLLFGLRLLFAFSGSPITDYFQRKVFLFFLCCY